MLAANNQRFASDDGLQSLTEPDSDVDGLKYFLVLQVNKTFNAHGDDWSGVSRREAIMLPP